MHFHRRQALRDQGVPGKVSEIACMNSISFCKFFIYLQRLQTLVELNLCKTSRLLPASAALFIYITFCALPSYLLPTIRGQIKHQNGKEGDAHAGDDQVHRVEQRLAPHCNVEGDIQVGLVATGVVLDVPDGRHLQDVPLDRHVELRQVHPDLHFRFAILLVNVSQVDLSNQSSMSMTINRKFHIILLGNHRKSSSRISLRKSARQRESTPRPFRRRSGRWLGASTRPCPWP